MLKCLLESHPKRRISVCNYNHHHLVAHPDRIMQEHDLIYMLSGEWEVWQDGIPYLLREGDLLLLSAGHHHYGVKPCTDDVHTIYVHFNARKTDACCEDPVPSENEFLFPIHFHPPAGSRIPHLLKQMVSAYWQQNIYASEQANAYLALLLCEMSVSTFEKTVLAGHDELIKRLLRTIESTPDHFYSVDELCGLINTSRKTLHNYFKKNTGMSPHAYQLKIKLKSARELLEKEPQIPLEDLVRRFGFCDEYHFSKMFKREFSVPPRKYAKSIKEAPRLLPDHENKDR